MAMGFGNKLLMLNMSREDLFVLWHTDKDDSAMWYDLLKIRDIYLQGRKMQIGNGEKTLSGRTLGCMKNP